MECAGSLSRNDERSDFRCALQLDPRRVTGFLLASHFFLGVPVPKLSLRSRTGVFGERVKSVDDARVRL